ncbi:MAG: hypothetical protein AAF985_14175 [Bacteroidota bacterium]
MKKIRFLLLLSLVMLPVIWNGMNLVHYVLEHTHAFCLTDTDHEHKSAHECLDLYHFSQSHDHNHLPTKVEFFELNQYITDFSSLNIQSYSSVFNATKAVSSFFYGRIYIEEIFHPPVA